MWLKKSLDGLKAQRCTDIHYEALMSGIYENGDISSGSPLITHPAVNFPAFIHQPHAASHPFRRAYIEHTDQREEECLSLITRSIPNESQPVHPEKAIIHC